jgi:hypothetical protein
VNSGIIRDGVTSGIIRDKVTYGIIRDGVTSGIITIIITISYGIKKFRKINFVLPSPHCVRFTTAEMKCR